MNIRYKHFSEIYAVCKKRDSYPDDKNFALIQNGFGTMLIHNFQQKGTLIPNVGIIVSLSEKSSFKL
ncbi:MAG: hypothetical protein ACI7YS_11105 [Flavobacterium sp.]